MPKNNDDTIDQGGPTEFDAAPGTAPQVEIEAVHGTLRYRTTDGTDTGKKLTAFPGQQVWLEATAKGEAEATVTTTWPLENGEEVRTITEPGLIYG
jgi:hypothetical protein